MALSRIYQQNKFIPKVEMSGKIQYSFKVTGEQSDYAKIPKYISQVYQNIIKNYIESKQTVWVYVLRHLTTGSVKTTARMIFIGCVICDEHDNIITSYISDFRSKTDENAIFRKFLEETGVK